jgi:hypothetical protein
VPELSNMVCVHKLQDPIEANLIRGLLLNAGIPAQLTGEGLVGAYSGVPMLCEVRILVPLGRRSDAERLLQGYDADRRRPASEQDWICKACGESNGTRFEVCWNCERANQG